MPSTTAGEVMDTSAALLNDVAKASYTYVAQLPYLNIALKELREMLELSNIPVTNETSTVITVPLGITVIGFSTTPALPNDLVDIRQLWESSQGSDSYSPMTKREFLPPQETSVSNFGIYSWQGNEIRLPASNQARDLKLDYIKQLFNTVIDNNSVIGIINGISYLHFRTAALCAQFIGENETRAEELNGNAELAIDRLTGIESKSAQSITTRRRPFRAGWKSRGIG